MEDIVYGMLGDFQTGDYLLSVSIETEVLRKLFLVFPVLIE